MKEEEIELGKVSLDEVEEVEGDLVESEMTKAPTRVDSFIDKMISRKLMVWLVMTGMFAFGLVTVDVYMVVTSVYLGSQGIADIFARKGAE